MKYFIYILGSKIDGTYYTGQTNNLKDRINRHNNGNIKTTKSKKPYKLCYYEEYETRAEAMYREWEIKKKYNTLRKKKLISSFDNSKLIDYLGL